MREVLGQVELLPAIAAELIAERPNVIVTAGPQLIAALSRATTTIPIVMAIVLDPVAYGFAESLARPGRNMTGLSMQNTELSGKRIALLREVVPAARRFAVFADPTSGPQGLPETKASAERLGLTLHVLEVPPDGISRGFDAARRLAAEALIVMPTTFYNSATVRAEIGALALQHRLPSVTEAIAYVRDGALMSYGPDFADMWRRSASYVDRILRGAHPAAMPIENPVKFSLVLNRRTADQLGLALPPTLVAQAEEVIE